MYLYYRHHDPDSVAIPESTCTMTSGITELPLRRSWEIVVMPYHVMLMLNEFAIAINIDIDAELQLCIAVALSMNTLS